MYQAVIFDLDGTLLNSLEDLAAAGNYALRQARLPEHPAEAYRYFIGNGIPKLIERIVGKEKEKTALVHEKFLAYYEVHKEDKTRPYPGILHMLKEIKKHNILMGVVSNKDDGAVQSMVQFYFQDMFYIAMGRRDGIAPKPNPALVLKVMEKMGVSPAETLYVGDSGVDMVTAKHAGTASCGVLWGFRTAEELEEAGADMLAAEPAELISHIL